MTDRLKVLVSRRIPSKGIEMLKEHFEIELNDEDRPLTAGELRARLKGKQGLVCLLQDKITDQLLSAAPELKIVSNVAVGFDNIDLAAATRHGVMATNTPEVLTDTTADFAFALLIATAPHVVAADLSLRRSRR